MCVIVIAPKTDPSLETLRDCEAHNRHGGGLAWAENGYVHFRKGIRADEMLDLIAKKPFPHIFHFRIASMGPVVPSLCHPFTVKRKHNCDMEGVTQNPVLFHNGTVPEWKFMAQLAGVKYPDFASDSMVIARIVSLRGESILSHLVSGNKFVVLHPSGKVSTYGSFTRKNGMEFSNLYWERYQSSHDRQSEQDACESCQPDCEEPTTLEASFGACPSCGSHKTDSDDAGHLICENGHIWEAKPAPPAPTPADHTVYTALTAGDIIQEGDEILVQNAWIAIRSGGWGSSVGGQFQFRRPVRVPPPVVRIAVADGNYQTTEQPTQHAS